MPYTDAEYEYFEQRQLPARPQGAPPSLHPLLQHQDKRPQEEQVYAEPILVNHPVNLNNPLGVTIIIMVVAMTMMIRTRVQSKCNLGRQRHQYGRGSWYAEPFPEWTILALKCTL